MERIEEKLFDYIEGRLSQKEKAEMDMLLEKDGALKKQLEEVRKADLLMTDHRLVELRDEEFTNKLMAGLEAKTTRAKTSNRILWMAVGIFTGIFAAVAAILLGSDGQLAQPATRQQYLPELPAFDVTSLLDSLTDPALIQLVVIINAIAVLLVVDRMLSKRMKHSLKTLF